MGRLTKLSIVGDLRSFMKVRKKWWLGPIMFMFTVAQYVARVYTGLGSGTVYLHAVLGWRKKDEEIGLLLPCNVVVYEKDDQTVVAVFHPMVMTRMVANEQIRPMAEELQQRLHRVPAAV